jgi:hypothetical protein
MQSSYAKESTGPPMLSMCWIEIRRLFSPDSENNVVARNTRGPIMEGWMHATSRTRPPLLNAYPETFLFFHIIRNQIHHVLHPVRAVHASRAHFKIS